MQPITLRSFASGGTPPGNIKGLFTPWTGNACFVNEPRFLGRHVAKIYGPCELESITLL